MLTSKHTLVAMVTDKPGVLNRAASLFRRRGFNIDSITVGHSELPHVSRMTIVVVGSSAMVEQVRKQLEKLVDVIKVFVHTSDQIICQEMALFKVTTKGLMSGNIIDDVVRTYHGRILEVSPEYIVIEKTGHKNEIDELLNRLEPYGVLQFVKSGRVAITKQVRELNSYLKEMDEANRGKEKEVEVLN